MNRFGLGAVLGACAVYAVWAWTIVKLDQANALLEDGELPTITVKKYGNSYGLFANRPNGVATTIRQPDFRERGDC